MSSTVAIAMWSGPRNVSTALMRSFGARDDTAVCDEPLYAHYLAATGLDHPMRDEVVERHETDWRRVVAALVGPPPGGRRVFYQKHMAHHLLPDVGRDWLSALTHAFLIREPKAMLASLVQHLPEPRVEDTGLPQQVALFDEIVRSTGRIPPVVCARELLLDPEGVLRQLTARLGIDFQPAMLAWAPGPRDSDGCWGPHWYAATYASTGFGPYRESAATLSPALRAVWEECVTLHRRLDVHRIRARE